MKLLVTLEEQERIINECKYTYENGVVTINQDKKRGMYIELLAILINENLGREVKKIINGEDNMQFGDLLIIENDISNCCECKSSHTWNCKSKLGIDIKHTELFQKDNEGNYIKNKNGKRIKLSRDKLGKIPYIQPKLGTDKGWLHNLNYDYICAINTTDSKCYMIYEAQKLLEKLRDLVDLYVDIFCSWSDWYKNHNNNPVNDFVEGSIKTDNYKESYIINLELSEESLQYFDVKYDIIDFEIEIEREKSPNSTANRKRTLSRQLS